MFVSYVSLPLIRGVKYCSTVFALELLRVFHGYSINYSLFLFNVCLICHLLIDKDSAILVEVCVIH
jgi:hypothetical protein